MQLKLRELTDLNTYVNAERSNRFYGAKIKKRETEYVAFECLVQGIKTIEKLNKITFIWKHKNKRKDMDNVEFSQKFIWDGLVKAKVIKNDNWPNRPPRTLHIHEVNKEDPGCVVVFK